MQCCDVPQPRSATQHATQQQYPASTNSCTAKEEFTTDILRYATYQRYTKMYNTQMECFVAQRRG